MSKRGIFMDKASKNLNNVAKGFFGQSEAEIFLQSKGMTLLETNFRRATGEIDLIVKDGTYFVFVEVKYRRSKRYGLPREAVNATKQKRIHRTALYYIAEKGLSEQDFRFDVVELLSTNNGLVINHIENAF